jgi:hypothetical protein
MGLSTEHSDIPKTTLEKRQSVKLGWVLGSIRRPFVGYSDIEL